MRILLAVLAWCVMVGGALGAVLSGLGAVAVVRQQGMAPSASAGPLLYLLVGTGFRLIESLALGLGLLFLLDLDKRVRTGVPGAETR